MHTTEDIKKLLEYELGDWNDSASVKGDTVTLMVGNRQESSDDPYAYEYEFNVKTEEFLCTGKGGYGRNWGTPYEAGLDTLEKVRYACECATRHNWRHWGGN
jgi:hypothetical protein